MAQTWGWTWSSPCSSPGWPGALQPDQPFEPRYGLSSFAATRPVDGDVVGQLGGRPGPRWQRGAGAGRAGGPVRAPGHRLLGSCSAPGYDAHPAGEVIAALAVAAVLLVLLTWKRMVESLILELIGREWVVKVMVIAGVFFSINVAVLAMWLAVHPEYHAAVRAGMPWVLSGLACLKLASGAVGDLGPGASGWLRTGRCWHSAGCSWGRSRPCSGRWPGWSRRTWLRRTRWRPASCSCCRWRDCRRCRWPSTGTGTGEVTPAGGPRRSASAPRP